MSSSYDIRLIVLLKAFKIQFEKSLSKVYPLEEIRHFFYILIEELLEENRFILSIEPNRSLTQEQALLFEDALAQLEKQKPIQYITGTTYFGDLKLFVNEHVLIPRPETLELISYIKACYDHIPAPKTILDIGTGSGCIAISLALAFPNAVVTAIEVSEDAIAVARQNIKNVHSNVHLQSLDILSATDLQQSYDLIVSNPPYVRALERAEMSENVLSYEPETALFVSDRHPLIFYKKISELAFKHLSKNGHLFFEINEYLGLETQALIERIGFTETVLKKDMFSKDRMIMAKINR